MALAAIASASNSISKEESCMVDKWQLGVCFHPVDPSLSVSIGVNERG